MKNLLFYLSPPLVGAIIGLFTNWLAIKMLFRPLAEKRILGLRLPFTPGVLPRERDRIAVSLGDTVAIDLLDEATIASRLSSPSFRMAIKSSALKAGCAMLKSSPADLGSGLDPELTRLAGTVFLDAIASIAGSESFSKAMEQGINEGFSSIKNIELYNFVPGKVLKALTAILEKPENTLAFSEYLANAFVRQVQNPSMQEKSLADYFNPSVLVSLFEKILDSAYPELINELSSLLNSKPINMAMEKAGAKIIRKALDRFSPMQRLFIGIGQYDKAILDNMPLVIADFNEAITAILLDDNTKKAFLDKASSYIMNQLKKPLQAFRFSTESSFFPELKHSLVTTLSSLLKNISYEKLEGFLKNATANTKAAFILDNSPQLSSLINKTLLCWIGSLLKKLSNPDFDCKDINNKGSHLHAACLPCLEPAKTEPLTIALAAFISTFSAQYKQDSFNQPLGNIISMDEAKLEQVADLISLSLSELAVKESSDLLKSLDIRSLVIEKINRLNMLELEQIILRIVEKELGAITMLGAVLGAIIGLFQTLFFLLR